MECGLWGFFASRVLTGNQETVDREQWSARANAGILRCAQNDKQKMQKQIPPLRYGMTSNRTDNGKGNDGDSGLRLRSGQNDERGVRNDRQRGVIGRASGGWSELGLQA
jgi:hypothetical protein